MHTIWKNATRDHAQDLRLCCSRLQEVFPSEGSLKGGFSLQEVEPTDKDTGAGKIKKSNPIFLNQSNPFLVQSNPNPIHL